MSSPAPLLKPPVPGNRNNGSRTPRLTLGIPPSPNVKPVNPETNTTVLEGPKLQRPAGRPAPPQLRLATPMGTQETPREGGSLHNGRPPPLQIPGLGDANGHSRTGSFTNLEGKGSGPASASSSTYSALSFAIGLRNPRGGTPDPSSAISSVDGGVAMERDNSMNGLLPDLDKLSLEKGRPLDVEDLDDEGWLAASEQGKIVELGSLGEGAGGAVTRCILKGAKTVFALKVGSE